MSVINLTIVNETVAVEMFGPVGPAGPTGSVSAATTLELGHPTDTTLSRPSAGNVAVEGNLVYRAGGTDVPITDGGTGSSTAADARMALVVQRASVVDQAAMTALTKASLTNGEMILAQQAVASNIVGGAEFVWDSTSTSTVNGGTIQASDEGGAGRWIARAGIERVLLSTFKVNADNSAAVNAPRIQAAIHACYGKELFIDLVGGVVQFDTGLVIHTDVTASTMNPNNLGIAITGNGVNGNGGALLRFTGGVGTTALSFTGNSANGDNRPLWFKGWGLRGADTDNANGPSGIALTLANAQTKLEDVWVYGFGNTNILLEDCFGATLKDVLSTGAGTYGVYVNRAANNMLLDHVKCIANGRRMAVNGFNMRLNGVSGTSDNLGPHLLNCDFEAAGSSGGFTKASGALTDIVVAAEVATATFSVSHGLSVGNLIGCTGATQTYLNGIKAVSTVPSATTITYYVGAVTNGTYSNTELVIGPPATGLQVGATRGMIIDTPYIEGCPQGIYMDSCSAFKISGGHSQASNIIIEATCTNGVVEAMFMRGTGALIYHDGSGQHDVDITMSNVFTSGGTTRFPTVYKRDGRYYSAAIPAAGAWVTLGTVVYNSAPAVGQPRGWVLTVAGTPGMWVALANL